jgi:integrase
VTATLTPSIRTYTTESVKQGRMLPKTASESRRILLGLAEVHGQRPVDKLGLATIERWLESINHLAPGSRRRYLSAVRGYTKWLTRKRMIRYDPCLDVTSIRVPRPADRALHAHQVMALLAVVPDARGRAIVWLMVGCGLRCIEICRLEQGDYDRHARTLSVIGKGGHARTVPVPSEVLPALHAYLGSTPNSAGPLIRNHHYPARPLQPKYVSHLCTQWMRAADLKTHPYDGVSGHALRHTAGSDVYERCENLTLVADFLGHASLEMARRYTRKTQVERIRPAIEGREYGSLVAHLEREAA